MASRSDGDFCIALCDIDHFKFIDDRYGHTIGDETLIHLGAHFSQLLRKYDIASRWGGEEFLLVLPDTDLTQGQLIAERIRSWIERTVLKASNEVKIALIVSCSVCSWRECQKLEELFRIADIRLYLAKNTGRNRIVSKG